MPGKTRRERWRAADQRAPLSVASQFKADSTGRSSDSHDLDGPCRGSETHADDGLKSASRSSDRRGADGLIHSSEVQLEDGHGHESVPLIQSSMLQINISEVSTDSFELFKRNSGNSGVDAGASFVQMSESSTREKALSAIRGKKGVFGSAKLMIVKMGATLHAEQKKDEEKKA